MNYVLVCLNSVPDHLKYCIRQILKVDTSSTITLITDMKIKADNIEIISCKDLNLPDLSKYFIRNDDPLWITSLMRIFIINEYLKISKNSIIHFDNDVLIFYPYETIKDQITSQVYITPHKHTEYTFGYSIIQNLEKFNLLTEKILDMVYLGEKRVRELITEPHEMSLLGKCGKNIITDLPVHPSIDEPMNNFIFDPSSYGQFVGGTPNGHAPGFVDEAQLVGSCFKLYPPCIKFVEKKPVLDFNSNSYKIFNLHIHSKQLDKYVT